MTFAAVDETLEVLREAHSNKAIKLSATEERWLDLLAMQRDSLSCDEEELAANIEAVYAEPNYLPEEYGL